MATPQTVRIENIETTTPNRYIRTSVWYTKRIGGGTISLNVKPLEIDPDRGFEKFTLMSGTTIKLEEGLKRHSYPLLKQWAERVQKDERYLAAIKEVCNQEGLILASEAERLKGQSQRIGGEVGVAEVAAFMEEPEATANEPEGGWCVIHAGYHGRKDNCENFKSDESEDESDEDDTGRIFNEHGVVVETYDEQGYYRSDAPDVDARGQCYSDADPGL